MDEEDIRTESDEINEVNDAREEDIVSDTDADAEDVIDNDNNNTDAIEQRFSTLEATLERILGEISSLREAQGIMVENGAVVHETDADIDLIDEDSFVPPAELDLLI